MTTEEIYAALGEKVGQNWAEYQERMTQLSPDTLFMKADEIAEIGRASCRERVYVLV